MFSDLGGLMQPILVSGGNLVVDKYGGVECMTGYLCARALKPPLVVFVVHSSMLVGPLVP